MPELQNGCGHMHPLFQVPHCFEASVENTVAIANEMETLTPADPIGSLAGIDATTKKSVGKSGCSIMLDQAHPTPFDVASVGASIQYAHKILEEDAVAARRTIAEYNDKSKPRFADWKDALSRAQQTMSSRSAACRDATLVDGGLVPQYFADCLKTASVADQFTSGRPHS